jgi:hypothetical protein
MNAVELFKKLDATKPLAERDLRLVNPGSYQGAVMMTRQAQNELLQLQKSYNMILNDLIKVKVLVVGGPDVAEALFKGLDVDVVGVDAKELYTSMAQKVFPSVGNRHEFNLHQVFMLNGLVKELTDQYNLRYEGLEGPSASDVTSLETCTQAVKNCIRTRYGNNLIVQTLTNKIRETAFLVRVAEAAALVITNVDDQEVDDLNKLYPGAVTLISVSSKPKDITKLREKIVSVINPKVATTEEKES